ncbi:ABC transporter ATP-binding protein [Ureaplasma sp. OM1]|uniref:ABC transporter ATP-binding protein n=2 Tax=Ureaplasma ceti TaxID=3119530 RepID=A0ABP9U5T1_9BACT
MIAQVAMDVIIPLLLTSMNNVLVDMAASPNVHGPGIIEGVHYSDLYTGGIHYTLIVMALMFAACLIEVVAGMLAASVAARLAVMMTTKIRSDLYRKVQGLSFADLEQFKTSSLITRFTTDTQTLQASFNSIFRIGVRATMLYVGGIIGTIVVVCTNHSFNSQPWSVPVLMVILSLVLLVTLIIIVVYAAKYFRQAKYATDDVNSVMRENVLGVRVVKSFNLSENQIERFEKVNTKMYKITEKGYLIGMILVPIINFVMSGAIVAILWVGTPTKAITVANVGTLMSISSFILLGMVLLINVILQMGIALSSAHRIKEVMLHKSSITYKEDGASIENPSIEFKHVNFRYSDTSEYVLKDINLKIDPNQTIGIIGETGSGKSTFVSLIARMYDVKEGEIIVSDENVKDINQKSLRKDISMSPQQVTLFSGTIGSNLKYGKHDATEADMIEACEGAQAMEFVNSKEAGFDSVVEQRARNFSGGQKQRLAIARALIGKPKILILDSSTSALDMITERKVNEYIKKTNHNRTTIVVGQRISGVKDADRILVLSKGQIVGDGSHKELLNNCKEYLDIALSQLGEEGVRNELAQ